MRFRLQFLLVGLFLATVLALGLSCSKKPTEPKGDPGFRLYVSDANTKNLYALDPLADSVLDSLPGLYPIDLLVSKDGKSLFMPSLPPESPRIQKIDATSLEVIGEHIGSAGYLALVDNGRTLIRGAGGILEYYNPVTFELVEIDSFKLYQLASADASNFILGIDSVRQLTCYAFREKRVLSADTLVLPGRRPAVVNYLSLHPSGREGYAIMHDSPYVGWFVVFETPSLELKYSFPLYSYHGEAAPSPDGRFVLVSDPGPVVLPPTTIGDLFVYDVAANEVVKTIHTDTLTLVEDFYPPVAVSQMAYSLDGTTAFISTGAGGWSWGPVLIFDMKKLEFVKRMDMINEGLVVRDIAVGPIP